MTRKTFPRLTKADTATPEAAYEYAIRVYTAGGFNEEDGRKRLDHLLASVYDLKSSLVYHAFARGYGAAYPLEAALMDHPIRAASTIGKRAKSDRERLNQERRAA